jgi:hypothetical protein
LFLPLCRCQREARCSVNMTDIVALGVRHAGLTWKRHLRTSTPTVKQPQENKRMRWIAYVHERRHLVFSRSLSTRSSSPSSLSPVHHTRTPLKQNGRALAHHMPRRPKPLSGAHNCFVSTPRMKRRTRVTRSSNRASTQPLSRATRVEWRTTLNQLLWLRTAPWHTSR